MVRVLESFTRSIEKISNFKSLNWRWGWLPWTFWDIVDESKKAPTFQHWSKVKKKDQNCIEKAMSLIGLSLAGNQLAYLKGCKGSTGFWKTLCSMHETRSLFNIVFCLQQFFYIQYTIKWWLVGPHERGQGTCGSSCLLGGTHEKWKCCHVFAHEFATLVRLLDHHIGDDADVDADKRVWLWSTWRLIWCTSTRRSLHYKDEQPCVNKLHLKTVKKCKKTYIKHHQNGSKFYQFFFSWVDIHGNYYMVKHGN